MTGPKPCPTGCGRIAQTGKLLCGLCWREVPKRLQAEVYRTFRAWWADKGNAEKFTAYRDAAEAAVASIR